MNKYIFQICLEIVLNDHNYSENSILRWPHWTFASPFSLRIIRLSVLSNDARRHANKGTKQIAEHRLRMLYQGEKRGESEKSLRNLTGCLKKFLRYNLNLMITVSTKMLYQEALENSLRSGKMKKKRNKVAILWKRHSSGFQDFLHHSLSWEIKRKRLLNNHPEKVV